MIMLYFSTCKIEVSNKGRKCTDTLIVEPLNLLLPFENFLPSNFTNLKKASFYYFISFFLFPLFQEFPRIYDTKYKKLFAIPSKPSRIINLSFFIISYKNILCLSRKLLNKKSLFILIPKVHGGEEKRRRKLRELCSVPGRNPLSNHERRWDKLISIQSAVSTDVEPTPAMGPKSNSVKIISR